jgi:Ankyrin repeats (many copies)
MGKPATGFRRPAAANDTKLMAPVKSIVSGNTAQVLQMIEAAPDLVRKSAITGASREAASQYFFPEIRHFLYAGDTALHMAAAGFKFELGQVLIDRGADCAAKNRRGAEPLHCSMEKDEDLAPLLEDTYQRLLAGPSTLNGPEASLYQMS